MKRKVFFLILFFVLIIPVSASAAVTIESMVNGAVTAAWVIATAVVVILWLVTGMLFLTAQGAPEKLGSAKKALFASIAGTVIVVLAFSMRSIIEKIISGGS